MGEFRDILEWLKRRSRVPILMGAFATAAVGVWHLALYQEINALNDLRDTGEERLNLYSGTVHDALEKYRYLPYLLARDPRIQTILQAGSSPLYVNQYLEDAARESGASQLMVLDRQGQSVARSDWRNQDLPDDVTYRFRPFFEQALSGESGGYFAIDEVTSEPGYYMSFPVRQAGTIFGVMVVKIDMTGLQREWREGGETVAVSDANGVIFLSSRDDWKYKSLYPIPRALQSIITEGRQYHDIPLEPLEIMEGVLGPDERIVVSGKGFLHQSRTISDLGWRIHYFSPLERVKNLVHAGIAVATITAFLLIAIGLYLRERRLKNISVREAREAQALKDMNIRLREEIAERQRTEQHLREAQEELVQAGKMAGLGQMSAAIAHELNQPLGAIRTFMASCRVLMERRKFDKVDENLSIVADLVERMASITGQLKVFARKGSSKMEPIELQATVSRVLMFIDHQVTHANVEVVRTEPGAAVYVRADTVRFEQVLLNLLRNGMDAMKEMDTRKLYIDILETGDMVELAIEDTGKGLPDGSADKLFDPFFTTKEVGEGLGLGLSITYGIVQDLGGSIRAVAVPNGGARFIVRLPGAEHQEMAAQ